jgi:16S rRNA processing protein RimM
VLRAEHDFSVDDLKALFIEVAGNKAPYFIKSIRESGPGFLVLLEEVNSVEAARMLVGKKLFISSDLIEEPEVDLSWLGFELVDKQLGSLGKILSVSDNGEQPLVTVSYKDREIILPIVEDFIEKVDEENQVLYFNAPEGLIDLYLEE